ncbi:putative thiol-disulfide oxidoreductase [Gordonia amicalis NBRC 100051 = JCM 11271]|nr:putative thiol-disulfide oxidoreductase [Gordonia amicalis NBRC 100051 = JCM 11271]
MALGAVLVATLVTAALTRPWEEPSAPEVTAPAATMMMNTNLGPAGDVPRRTDDDPLVFGAADAPVTMVVFEDFRCEYCIVFTREIQPALVDRYVDTGILRVEWRDAPMAGPQSWLAARAGRAAAAQDRFWEFVRVVMEGAPADRQPEFTEESLTAFARRAGVTDLERFGSDMRGGTFDLDIESDLRLAKSLFIPPTPAFWINGTPLLAGMPLPVFIDVIEGVRPAR